MTCRFRPITAAVAIAVTVATAPSLAPALSAARLPHLKLKRSFPAKDTVLTTSPDAIRLWLTEKADLPATRITLASAGGGSVTVDKSACTRREAVHEPQPLAAGRYLVTWKTMSKDGHVVNGTFGFEVKGK